MTWYPKSHFPRGLFTFYVEKILGFFDPSLSLRRQFIYWGLYTSADFWETPPSLSLVYVECESPLIESEILFWGAVPPWPLIWNSFLSFQKKLF